MPFRKIFKDMVEDRMYLISRKLNYHVHDTSCPFSPRHEKPGDYSLGIRVKLSLQSSYRYHYIFLPKNYSSLTGYQIYFNKSELCGNRLQKVVPQSWKPFSIVLPWFGVAQKIAFPTQSPAKTPFPPENLKYFFCPIFARIFTGIPPQFCQPSTAR